jgi:hypothetical protein
MESDRSVQRLHRAKKRLATELEMASQTKKKLGPGFDKKGWKIKV